MSACSSNRWRTGRWLILAALSICLTSELALAKTVERVKRVSVGSRGVVIEREVDRDSLDSDSLDSSGTFHTRIGRRHGWIEVDDDHDALVRVFSDAHVPAGETVTGDVVAVFGSVEVEGKVDGDVVAVLGSVHLSPGASVGGDAVSIGGVLDQQDGADVGGETVSVGFMPSRWGVPAVSLTLSAVLAGWLAAMVTGWLLVTLFPVRTVRVATIATRRTSASLLVGLLSIPMFVAALFLLFVTVVGIPLALLLPPAYFLLCFAGQLAATYVLGCKLTGRRLGTGGLMMPVFAGTLLMAGLFALGAAMFVIPGIARPMALFLVALAGLMVMGLTSIGTGAFLLSKLGAEPREVTWSPGPLAPPAPSPDLAPPPTAPA